MGEHPEQSEPKQKTDAGETAQETFTNGVPVTPDLGQVGRGCSHVGGRKEGVGRKEVGEEVFLDPYSSSAYMAWVQTPGG